MIHLDVRDGEIACGAIDSGVSVPVEDLQIGARNPIPTAWEYRL